MFIPSAVRFIGVALLVSTISATRLAFSSQDDVVDQKAAAGEKTTTSTLLWRNVCTQHDTRGLPFCNRHLPIHVRVDDYVSRIAHDLPSMAQMMVNDAEGFAPLHIPPYQWWSEGLHGPLQPCVCDHHDNNDDDDCRCPTSFPSPSALATSFNATLWSRIGKAIGREARALNNLLTTDDNNNHHSPAAFGSRGLDYWSPTINMQRDPRWGRNQEVPGEDPYLTGQYAIHYVRGLQQQQGNDSENNRNHSSSYVQIAACCKHFLANSLERWGNVTRHNFNANLTKADLANYYLPAFEDCVVKGASLGIMCSYNAVQGQPACANDYLLDTLLRQAWHFSGYVTSDCGAIADIFQKQPDGHGYATNATQATAMALAAGTDLNCGIQYNQSIPDAVRNGLVTEEQVRQSFARLVQVQMQLGLFDQPKENEKLQPYFHLGIQEIDSVEHQALARQAAQQSIVLLQNKKKAKNKNNAVLPLQPGRRVAVLGPHFNATAVFLSNYHGQRCLSDNNGDDDFSCMVTPLQAIAAANIGGETVGAIGCHVVPKRNTMSHGNNKDDDDDDDMMAAAIALAKTADDIVLVMGLDQTVESEGIDRIETTLPGLQVELMTRILALQNPSTVLVLVHGGAVSLGVQQESVPAILAAGYGGQAAAQALADVLYGHYNPSAKLAATMYPPNYVHEIPLTEMGLQVPPGRTHMYYSGIPEFAFGHGLSYTTWELNWADNRNKDNKSPVVLRLNEETPKGAAADMFQFDVEVKNVGDRVGTQTVLLFLTIPPSSSSNKNNNDRERILPMRQKLLAFQSAATVSPQKTRVLHFNVENGWHCLAVADRNGDMVVTPGRYDLCLRDGQNELCKSIRVQIVTDSSMSGPLVVERFPREETNDFSDGEVLLSSQ